MRRESIELSAGIPAGRLGNGKSGRPVHQLPHPRFSPRRGTFRFAARESPAAGWLLAGWLPMPSARPAGRDKKDRARVAARRGPPVPIASRAGDWVQFSAVDNFLRRQTSPVPPRHWGNGRFPGLLGLRRRGGKAQSQGRFALSRSAQCRAHPRPANPPERA